jgi:hypothetical protein
MPSLMQLSVHRCPCMLSGSHVTMSLAHTCLTLKHVCTCSSAVACNIYREIADRRSDSEYRQDTMSPPVGWSETLPWLFYPSQSNRVFIESDDVHSKLLFKGGSLLDNKVSKLSFLLAAYSLSGEYLGLEMLTDQLQVCFVFFMCF